MSNHRFFLHALAALLILTLLPIRPARAASPRQDVPRFEVDRCAFGGDFQLPGGAREGENVDCGWLIVPEEHARPDGPTLRLAVVIIRTQDPNPAPDPLVMLQGGPGGSSIDVFLSYLFGLTGRSPLLGNRDIILFDQRGTLYSEPSLQCPELIDLTEELIDERVTIEESEQRTLEAYAACHARLVSRGLNLAAFDSVENAHDIEALRVALGYDQINLYGVSYGTQLALHTMREHPAALRAVILDSVSPLQLNFIPQVPRSMQRAFDTLFAACAADAECNRAYPELEQRFYDLVDQLNREPLRLPITDAETGITYDAVLDGDTLINLLFQFLYASEAIPALPKMIDELRTTGDSPLLRVFWPILAFDRTFSGGMYNAVICAEDADFTEADLAMQDVRPELQKVNAGTARYFAELCQEWAVPPLPASVDDPVVSDIPTLVFNGQFDPITPPAFGELAAQTLSRSQVVTFPTTAHGSALAGECPATILYAFLDDPTAPADTSCIDAKPRVVFFTPRTIVMTPVFQRLVFESSTSDLVLLGLLALGTLWLLTPWVVYPLAWLIGRLRRRTTEQPLREQLGRWLARGLALVAGALAAVFIIGVVAAAGYTLFNDQFLLLYGLPRWAMIFFVLPPLLIVVAVLMVIRAVFSLRDRGWGAAGRLYYAALTLGLIVYMALLAPLGWLWVWA